MNIVVIDYGMGNTRSVMSALKHEGADPIMSNDRDEILTASGVILPGVGSFPHGMAQLKHYGLVDTLAQYTKNGKPLLGICLGMQMLLSKGTEFATTPGLGLIAGKVAPLASRGGLQGRVPHVGWSPLTEPSPKQWDGTILYNIEPETDVYFVHSFIAEPEDEESVLAITPYQGVSFCSAIGRGNIYGCQFHPEKSGSEGLKILKNFLEIAKRV